MNSTLTYITILLLLVSLLGYLNHRNPVVAQKLWDAGSAAWTAAGTELDKPAPILTKETPQAPTPLPATPTPTPTLFVKVTTPTPPPALPIPTPTKPPAPIAWTAPSHDTIYPKEWITTDGTQYQGVSVQKVEPDCVSILHQDGACLLPISTLPPQLQTLLHYNPMLADEAAKKRSAAEQQEDAAYITSQQELAAQQQQAAQADAQARLADQASNKAARIAYLQQRISELNAQANAADAAEQDRRASAIASNRDNRVMSFTDDDTGNNLRQQAAQLQAQLTQLEQER